MQSAGGIAKKRPDLLQVSINQFNCFVAARHLSAIRLERVFNEARPFGPRIERPSS
jgi:hypothetical protein